MTFKEAVRTNSTQFLGGPCPKHPNSPGCWRYVTSRRCVEATKEDRREAEELARRNNPTQLDLIEYILAQVNRRLDTIEEKLK